MSRARWRAVSFGMAANSSSIAPAACRPLRARAPYLYPLQTRAMDRQDIRELRRWQGDAAKRAVQAGFDIVYVYAGHAYLPFQFIAKRFNHRRDEYGGKLENRV